MAEVAVVIVNYRTPELTMRCVDALRGERASIPSLRVVVVDGGSEDDSVPELAAFLDRADLKDWVAFLPLAVNGGFGWANNEAICWLMQDQSPPDFVHLLNPDSVIEPGAVLHLVQFLQERPDYAAVGSQLIATDGRLAGSGFRFPILRDEVARAARTAVIEKILLISPLTIPASPDTNIDWTTGASVMFRAEALQEVGLFDEGFFLYHEEVELMWRLRKAGWRVGVQSQSRVHHIGGASTGVDGGQASAPMLPRKPRYWFRSRTRFFSLTRGKGFAALAFFAWLVGYVIWFFRWHLKLSPDGKPFDHGLRDHLAHAFPRSGDSIPAIRRWDASMGGTPAWMHRAQS